MGQPAARLGDMTAHGGVIVMGFPLVLIGGMPAARMGDMHVCPMVTGVVPHVGGPIIKGSPTVLIGGMMAARVGDMAVCVGPPDTIVLGCFTVLIGEAGAGSSGGGSAGGGGGSGGGGSGSAVAVASVAVATTPPPIPPSSSPPSKEGHWIKYEFVDTAGNPISGVPYKFTAPDGNESKGFFGARGTVWWSGENAGQGKVTLMSVSNARWSQQKAQVGDKVKLTADVEGYPPGTKATFGIYEQDVVGADDFIISIEGQTQANKVEVEWEYQYIEDTDDVQTEEEVQKGYSSPEYYFIVKVEGQQARSGLLEYKDWIEIELKDENGKPMANEDYILRFSNGEVRKGKLDANGKKREDKIPPVKHYVVFPNYESVIKVD